MGDQIKRRKKRLQEANIGQRVPGTDVLAQKYWDFMERYDAKKLDDNDLLEDPLANPDVLSSDAAVFDRPLTERGEVQFEAILATLRTLTLRQQQILQLMLDGIWNEERGERDFTEEAIAKRLHITQQAVASALSLIRTKVRRQCEKLMTEEES